MKLQTNSNNLLKLWYFPLIRYKANCIDLLPYDLLPNHQVASKQTCPRSEMDLKWDVMIFALVN